MQNYQASITCSACDGQHIRHFAFGVRINTGRRLTHVVTQSVAENPVDQRFSADGAKTINKLLAVAGVVNVTTYDTELSVQVRQDLDGEALENVFLQIIKDNLFPGVVFRTQIRELVA